MCARAVMTTLARASQSAVCSWQGSGRGVQAGAPAPPACSQAEPLSTAPRVVKFMSGLSAAVAEEGQDATFQCVVTPSDAAVTWSRDSALLQSSEKFLISQTGASHSLTILGLTLEDAGQITAEAEGVRSTAALRVRGSRVAWQGGPPQGLLPGWYPVAGLCATCLAALGVTGLVSCSKETLVGLGAGHLL